MDHWWIAAWCLHAHGCNRGSLHCVCMHMVAAGDHSTPAKAGSGCHHVSIRQRWVWHGKDLSHQCRYYWAVFDETSMTACSTCTCSLFTTAWSPHFPHMLPSAMSCGEQILQSTTVLELYSRWCLSAPKPPCCTLSGLLMNKKHCPNVLALN